MFKICSTFEMVTEQQTQSCIFISILTFIKHKVSVVSCISHERVGTFASSPKTYTHVVCFACMMFACYKSQFYLELKFFVNV
jgi:hypothetical protein